MITQERLKERLNYDPDTGVFTWAVRGKGIKEIGCRAGTFDASGYIVIMIDAKQYKSHRLAWLYIHGEFPPDQIDHINRIKDDNRIKNLRCVTQKGNSRNSPLRKDNNSGVTGVTWNKKRGKWEMQIRDNNGKDIRCCFEDFNDAITARKQAEVKYGYHKNHGLKPIDQDMRTVRDIKNSVIGDS